jgi:uncharacterized membrane protein YjgN (DUF898 family)
MASELTELMEIFLYLLLTLMGGAMIAVLVILLIILIGALAAWLAIQVSSFKKRSESFDSRKSSLDYS